MVTLYRTSDKIEVKMGEISFMVSPLNYEQKSIINSKILSGKAENMVEAVRLAIKYAVKGVKGIQLSDGSEYNLNFDDKGVSDECLDDLSNLEQNPTLSLICGQLIKGIPKDFINPETGKPIEGVSIIRKNSEKK